MKTKGEIKIELRDWMTATNQLMKARDPKATLSDISFAWRSHVGVKMTDAWAKKSLYGKVAILVLLLIVQFTTPSLADPIIYSYTGKVAVVFHWDHEKDSNFDHYEVELRRLKTDGQVAETFTYASTNLQVSILRPRAGMYEARVRTVNKTSAGVYLYSEWCSSLNATCAKRKDGTNGDWKVKWKLSAPLIIMVE